MTKKKNLTAFMIAIIVMLFSLPVNAQGTVGYVEWDGVNTLTFKGGASVPTTGAYKLYELNTDDNNPDWNNSAVMNSCTKVVFDASFNDVRPTSCHYWFNGFSNLSIIEGIEYLNTDNVTNMFAMFYGCSGLTTLDVSKFNTAKVKYMASMFGNCSGLTSLDLSSFNTAKVTLMNSMFYGCSKLTTIYVSDDFTTDEVIASIQMFQNCTNLKGAVEFDRDNLGKSMANYKTGYFTKSNLTPYVKWNADTNVLTFKVAHYIEGTAGEWIFNEGANDPGWSIDEVKNNCTKVVFTPSFKQVTPTSCYSWFYGFSNLTTIQGIENLNTEEVKNMGYMFGDCKGLTSLDLSTFNTAKVTNMDDMFNECSGLTTIYVSDDFKIGDDTNGLNMFTNCNKLVGAAQYSKSNTDKDMANYKTGYFKTYFTYGEKKVELCGNPLTTKSLDLTGDYDFTPKYEFKANEATYSRDLSSSESTWFSLCLPFAYTPNNFTAYKLMSATADAVEIEEISETIAAGTPVLFKFKVGANKEINLSATDAQIVKAPVEVTPVIDTDGSSLQLCGTYQTKTFSKDADGNAFILQNNKLMNPANMLKNENVKKVSVKPFRAYMTLTASAQTSSARAFSIGHGGEEGTTAIDLLNSVATDDAEYYDINGRRIDAPVKGVNIVRRGNKTMKLIIK